MTVGPAWSAAGALQAVATPTGIESESDSPDWPDDSDTSDDDEQRQKTALATCGTAPQPAAVDDVSDAELERAIVDAVSLAARGMTGADAVARSLSARLDARRTDRAGVIDLMAYRRGRT